jgi:putative DNA primase/helicase
VANGVLDLRVGNLKINKRENYITKQCLTEFRPEAKCPEWLSFLEQVTMGDQLLIDYLQRSIGYSLTGDASEQIFFFFYGYGSNGKGTILNTIQLLLGDYAAHTDSKLLTHSHQGGIDDSLALLKGTRFVTTTETDIGVRFNEAKIKQLTGQDPVQAQAKYKDSFSYIPEFKIWLASNNQPPIRGTDYGIWRRIRVIPFEVKFSGKNKDTKLDEKLKAELPGILNWAVEGCLEWQQNGLQTPQKVIDATNRYRLKMDIVRTWLTECCGTTQEQGVHTLTKDLYQGFKDWCGESGERYVMPQKDFTTRLKSLDYTLKHTRLGNAIEGVTLIRAANSEF